MRIEEVFGAVPRTCEAKKDRRQGIDLHELKKRKSEYAIYRMTNLEYRIPEKLKVPFEDAREISVQMPESLLEA